MMSELHIGIEEDDEYEQEENQEQPRNPQPQPPLNNPVGLLPQLEQQRHRLQQPQDNTPADLVARNPNYIPLVPRHPLFGEDKRRCKICLNNLPVQNYRKAKNGLSKTKLQCMICKETICNAHYITVCNTCQPSCFFCTEHAPDNE